MKALSVLFASVALCAPGAALAQRTGENAVTQAGDAFGSSVGNEKIGIYSPEDVRGFNPIDAGNARIEGLYFDQQERVPNRIVDGNTIRVGIAAQRYPFPAPTGIVDYRLILPGKKPIASVVQELGPFGGAAGSIEVQIPITASLGISGGVGGRNQERPEGGSGRIRNFGFTVGWRPTDRALVAVFAGGYFLHDDEARATLFAAGNSALPRVPPRVFLGQAWTDRNMTSRAMGLVSHFPLGAFKLEAGAFRSNRKTATGFSDILSGVTPDGRVASRTIIADGNSLDESYSGEVRLSRQWTHKDRTQTLFLSVKGRRKERLFGGTQRIALGASSAILADFRPRPSISLGPKNRDVVRQASVGIGYSVGWQGIGSVDLSVSKSRYSKTITLANPALPVAVTRDSPLLWSVSGTLTLSPRLALYGGYVRGFEETLVAPEIATNRNEAPPAARTRQVDFGIRYSISRKLTLVAGLFSVRKPYFNIDPSLRYRQLGSVDNRGIEVSLSGQIAPGLSIVSGTVLLDPQISGEAVTAGLIGKRPIGSAARRTSGNLDWRLNQGKSPFSFDIAIESFSKRTANGSNALSVPARETVNLGARYRFSTNSFKGLFRLQVINVFDDYGWLVSSSGGLTIANSRTFTAQLLFDF
ncbi:MAG: hypothetical protein RIS52_537 [Pseudomonadota bacterium]